MQVIKIIFRDAVLEKQVAENGKGVARTMALSLLEGVYGYHFESCSGMAYPVAEKTDLPAEAIKDEIEVRLYPNPTRDNLIVSGRNLDLVSVYGIIGQIVMSSQCNNFSNVTIDMKAFSPGGYYAKVADQNGRTCVLKAVKGIRFSAFKVRH